MATIVTRSGKGSPLTHAEVDGNFTNLNTDKLELSGGTMTGNLSFGDNDKAIFGAGSDLQIYHDGSHSYVDENGTGQLKIRSNGTGVLLQTVSGENLATFANNAAVSLYYDNATKLATTSTGVDITGTLTSDGLTVDGDVDFSTGTGSNVVLGNTGNFTGSETAQLVFEEGSTELAQVQWNPVGNTFVLENKIYNAPISFKTYGATERLKIDGATGDISFYEDTGTTPKFFWDASAESLGIGTTSTGSETLVVEKSSGTPSIRINAPAGSEAQLKLQADAGGASFTDTQLIHAKTDASLAFSRWTGAAYEERMRIDSNGKVGIGISDPSTPRRMDVVGNATDSYSTSNSITDNVIARFRNGSDSSTAQRYGGISLESGNAQFAVQTVQTGTYGGALTIKTRTGASSYAERMRIDSSGNLLVGTTSASTTTVGARLKPSGRGDFTANGGTCSVMNRLTNFGDVISFQKDGSSVGGIGAATSTTMYVSSSAGGGLRFTYSNSEPVIAPCNTTGGNLDGTADLGASTIRFRDLYLSGGVYLGGTGAANKLDDYEEGTWTPTLGRSSVNPTTTYSRQSGYYIKVGAMVTLFFNMQFGTVSNVGSGTLRINGIPFNTSSDTNMRAAGTFGYNDAIVSTGVENIRIQSTDGANHLLIIAQVLDSTKANNLFSADPTSAKYLQGSITYKTDS